ncbi:peptidyl-prolyl cis-trans isomerase [Marimonas lutisalis]|uniref:peptidyl-prolyl cis-trans isomerase n=1 Tax=Marimonas lutisalis TaxID=2545756 RepID=UPI0010F4768A|nr:peptidyl-prolyl cis-trans isomerase [Marimonas lutisalis]
MARGSTTKTLVWILMALLILGLGGFGVTNLSGNIRTIGDVGGKEITVNEYVRALQDEIRTREAQTGQPIPFPQARAMGLDQVALARLIGATALDAETASLGISIGDDNLADQLQQLQGLQGIDGKFDREAYKFFLDRSGQTEAEFENGIRDEMARGLLQAAMLAGVPAPDTYADTILKHVAERRNFTWARLGESDLAEPLPAPTAAELETYHQDNAAAFTLPEMKRITYAWLAPDMLADDIQIDDALLREKYEERAEEFNQPERRLVERLAFPDEASAEAAKIALESDEKSFEDIVAERGLDLADVDMGDVLQSDLGEAGPAAFNADAGAVVGPFATDLGPALFRVNAVLPARTMSFEDARDELRDELAADRARRAIGDEMGPIDDLLAAGATIEELAQETDMQLGTLDWTPESSDGPAGYIAFQDAAQAVKDGDFPELIELDDGGIATLRLDEMLAPRLQPLEDVRDDVIAAWQDTETARRLASQAQALLPQITPEADMAALGLTVTQETDITRGEFIAGTSADFLTRVFEMEPGAVEMIEIPAAVLIVRLDAILPPDDADEAVPALRAALAQQMSSGQAQDIYQYFISDVQARAGLQLDENAINAVLANFQ